MNKKEAKLRTEELLSNWCCPELAAAANKWMSALGTADEEQATAEYISELREDIVPVDEAVVFLSSPNAAEYFGAEKAAEMAAHMKEIKAKGAIHCDCTACSAASKVLKAITE